MPRRYGFSLKGPLLTEILLAMIDTPVCTLNEVAGLFADQGLHLVRNRMLRLYRCGLIREDPRHVAGLGRKTIWYVTTNGLDLVDRVFNPPRADQHP